MLPIDPVPLAAAPSAGGDQAGAGAVQPGARGSADGGYAPFSDSVGDSESGKAREQFPGISTQEQEALRKTVVLMVAITQSAFASARFLSHFGINIWG